MVHKLLEADDALREALAAQIVVVDAEMWVRRALRAAAESSMTELEKAFGRPIIKSLINSFHNTSPFFLALPCKQIK